ncbi:DUF4060 family protein, partial [Salmonella enterica]|uniref:DUF4060 family protein n=1 Tax=Salmonella enterica TaxID=28901 RepID=UPI001C5610E8
MKLITISKHSPIGGHACVVPPPAHHQMYGDYGRQKQVSFQTVVADVVKVLVQVVNRVT